MTVAERSFPSRCPSCRRLNADAANPHCASPSCPWLRCTCGAVSNEDGKFQIVPGGAL